MKTLDLNKNVHELANEYPEFVDIMKELGFDQIANPTVRAIVGKKMTIPFGCKLRRFDLNEVIKTFEARGFEVINKPDTEDKDERTH